ncbi:MAG: DegT/DnrJ/EryC1/StrS family aminotransferase [Wenzhouxiangella sp.]
MTHPHLVPDTPTLYPSMLLGLPETNRRPPFRGGDVHWYFLARNAIFEACRLLGLGGSQVLMPAYHHGVEVEAVVAAGARPVFYRVDAHWQVDLKDLERRIGPETKALYLIHYAGFPGPAAQMRQLANDRGLALIEDCALSLLSCDGVSDLGARGDVSIYCLYKTLPVPNGGALMFNRPRRGELMPRRRPPLASVLSLTLSSLLLNLEMRAGRAGSLIRAGIRWMAHGVVRASGVERYAVGTMHFDPQRADLGISPLARAIAERQRADHIVATRRRNYLLLHDRLKSLAPPLFERLNPGVCPLFYPLWVGDKSAMIERLAERGICAVNFWGDHHPACNPAEFPEAMSARRHIVEIPCHQDLSLATMEWIAEQVALELRGCETELDPSIVAGG